MEIELTYTGLKDGVPCYQPIDATSQQACEGKVLLIAKPKPKGTRTKRQNNALHLFLSRLSKALNDAGYDMRKTLKPDAEIPWDNEGKNAKNNLWRPVQKALTGKESTTDLETVEVSQVYEALNNHIASKFGVHVAFPEIYQLLYEQEDK